MPVKGETVRSLRAEGSAFLAAHGSEGAPREADALLCHALRMGPAGLRARLGEPVGPPDSDAYRGALRLRAEGRPLQYIVGSVGFMGHEIRVDGRVLIPRPETEGLAELAVEACEAAVRAHGRCDAMDMCTGSGCLAIALAKAVPGCLVTAADLDGGALEVAGMNVAANLAVDRVSLASCDIFNYDPAERYDVFVCNPPYVASRDIPSLEASVRGYEPLSALDGGEDGLGFYRAIRAFIGKALKPRGVFLLEMGMGQHRAVEAIFSGFRAETLRDLRGVRRYLVGANAEHD
ncbi:MAG: peptide chain release factor N(5)-glutamine methyltransferase [Oscillospiraceae bacterium]|nr:peptide chain release factor N(5)-glutamine methyltransferase [Oscillospiraceae bacterium]